MCGEGLLVENGLPVSKDALYVVSRDYMFCVVCSKLGWVGLRGFSDTGQIVHKATTTNLILSLVAKT